MQEFSQKTGASKLLTVIFIILGIAVGAGSVWYYMDQKASDDKAGLQTQVNTLTAEVSSLKTSTTGSTDPTSSEGSTTSSAPSGNATLFSHKELGFSFSLPSGYIASDSYNCEGTCTANLQIDKFVSGISYSDTAIKLIYNKTGYTVDQMVSNDEIGSDKMGETDITVDGAAGKKISVGGFATGHYYYVVKNGFNLEIQQYPNNDENQAVVDKILATFKFSN